MNQDEVYNETGRQLDKDQNAIKPLNQDYSTPFSPADDSTSDDNQQAGVLDPTHQATDSTSDIDSQQLYDEGLAGAAEASEPNAGNTVIGYDPDKDQRKTQES